MAKETLVKRHQKIAFYGVPSDSGEITYHKMKHFTSFSESKNAKEYSRQYVDEAFETTDVTGYAPSISYGFDQYKNNPVHEDIVKITDGELTGSDAVRSIVLVDFTEGSDGVYSAKKKYWSVIPDSEGDSTDAYTYSGSFRSQSAAVVGKATVTDDTLTFA